MFYYFFFVVFVVVFVVVVVFVAAASAVVVVVVVVVAVVVVAAAVLVAVVVVIVIVVVYFDLPDILVSQVSVCQCFCLQRPLLPMTQTYDPLNPFPPDQPQQGIDIGIAIIDMDRGQAVIPTKYVRLD